MKQDETKKMISEIEMSGLMGKIIDHCFHRWSEKEMLIANRIKFFLEEFITHKLATQRKQWVEEMGFYEFISVSKEFLKHYPSDIWTGGSSDKGSAFVVGLRKLIESLENQDTNQ